MTKRPMLGPGATWFGLWDKALKVWAAPPCKQKPPSTLRIPHLGAGARVSAVPEKSLMEKESYTPTGTWDLPVYTENFLITEVNAASF